MDLTTIKERVRNARTGLLNSRRIQVALVSFFVLIVIAYFAYPFITGTEATPYLIGRVTYPAATSPYAITAADFDGVNGVDTAVLSDAGTPDTLSVFLKNGTSTFGTRTDYSLGGSIVGTSICSANFDNANGVDIAVANESNDILIFYNDGSGGFSGSPTTVSVGTGTSLIHCDDLNGDGRADLSARSGSSIVVLTNNNYSGFNAVSTYASGYNIYSFAIGDLNYDGFVDIATGTSALYTTSKVVVFRNNSNAGFLGADTVYTATYTACSTWCTNTAVAALKIADFNGDGKNDLVYTPQGVELTFKNIAIAPNTTSSSGGVVSFSSFIEEHVIYGNTQGINDIFPYDFDGDGDKDIVAVGGFTNGVTIYLENVGGFGFYGPEAFTGDSNVWGTLPANYDYVVSNPGDPKMIVVADFDLDGDADIASPNNTSAEMSVLYLTTVPTLSTISPTIVAKNDVLTLTTNGERYTGNGVSTIKMSGTNLGTTYVTEQQLTTPLTITQTGTVGTYPITVFNGAPGGGETSLISLTIVPAVFFSAPTDSANEGVATQKDFTISLSDAIANNVVVNYTLSGTADNNTDYTAASLSGTATILAGNTSVIVTFPLNDDLADEVDETIIMTLDSVVGTDATIRSIQNIQTLTILDDDPPPTLSFTSTTFSGSEGDYAYVGYQVDQYSGKTITAQISIADVTTTGADYSNVTNFVITPGTASSYFTISLNSDAAYDPDETFTVTIDSADWAILGTPLASTVTITDNHPTPYVSATIQNLKENNLPGSQTQQVEVLLPIAFSAGPTTVDINVVTGGSAILNTDYTFSAPQTVTFPANVTTATFNVTTINDSTSGDTNIIFGFSNCSCGYLNPDFTVNIIDNNPITRLINQDPTPTLYENNGTQALYVRLQGAFPTTVTFDVNVTGGTADNGVDYTFTNPTTVTFSNPSGFDSQTFNVTTISNAIYNEPKTIKFTISNCVNCNLVDTAITATIFDNNNAAHFSTSEDAVVVEGNSLSDRYIYIDNTPVTTDTVTFHIDTASTATYGALNDYTIDTTGGISYDPEFNTGTATFTGTNLIYITLNANSDAFNDSNESVIFIIDSFSAGQVGSSPTLTYTIQDQEASIDPTTIVVSHPEAYNTTLPLNTHYVFTTVNLNKSYPFTTLVTFHLAGTASYGTLSANDFYLNTYGNVQYDSGTNIGTVTFYGYDQQENIYLNILNNAIAEPEETVVIVLDSFDQGSIGTNSTSTHTIENDDANRIGFATSAASGSESTTPYNITVQLDIPNAQPTTFNFLVSGTATNTSDYTVSTGSFTIPEGLTTATVPIPLNIVNNTINEPNETVILQLDSIVPGTTVGGTYIFTYTITDNDPVYAKIFLDTERTIEANTTTNKINIDDTLYFRVNDARFNITGGADTISSSIASVISDGGDSEGVTFTETDPNIFEGSIVTASGGVAADVILQLAGADTVNLVLNSSSTSSIDDFSTYSSTSTDPGALIYSSNGLSGYWGGGQAAAGSPSLQTNAGQYLSSTSSGGDMYVVRGKSTAAATGYNFSGTNLVFDIAISDAGYSTDTWLLGGQTFTGFNILILDNLYCYYYQHVTAPISTNASALTTITIPRTGPPGGFVQASIGAPCTFNFSDVRNTYFIVPSLTTNTVTIDNFGQSSTINFQSPDALVVGGPTEVTLNAAANITTSSMDLDWTQNEDVDFANYKVYYSTTSPVSLASTLATPDPFLTPKTNLTKDLTGLAPSTQYYIRVLVTNATGGKNWSNEISPSTLTPPPGTIQITNSSWTPLTSITIGDNLYFEAVDGAYNISPSVAETIYVRVTSSLDTEWITLTAIGLDSGTFHFGPLSTSAANSAGVLAIADGDTISAKVFQSGYSNHLSDDFESYSNSAQAAAGWIIPDANVTTTLDSTNPTDKHGIFTTDASLPTVTVGRGSAATDYGSSGFTFVINADSLNLSGIASINGNNITGFAVVLGNSAGQMSMAPNGASYITSAGENIVTIPQSAFDTPVNTGVETLISDWSTINIVYFIIVSGNAVQTITLDAETPSYLDYLGASAPFQGIRIITNQQTSGVYNNLASVTAGDTLYFEVEDASLNTSSGSIQTVNVTVTSASDSEVITLYEINSNSRYFRNNADSQLESLVTSTTNSAGVLGVVNGDTITAGVESPPTILEDFDPANTNVTMNEIDPAGLDAYSITNIGGGVNTTNFWNKSVNSVGNVSGANPLFTFISPVNFGSGGLSFRVRLSSVAALNTTTGTNFPGGSNCGDLPTPLTGISVFAVNGSMVGCNVMAGFSYATVSGATLSSLSDDTWATITISQGDFAAYAPGYGIPAVNWSSVSEIGVAVVTGDGISATAAVISLDDLQITASGYSDTASVTANVTPIAVTLYAATNITTSSMDLSWSENVDGDFASYKIYYATHSNVTTADTLATTITNQATPPNQATTTYTLTGLTSATYYVRVLVTNTALDTAFSNEISSAINPSAGVTVTATIPPQLSYSLSNTNCNLGTLTDTSISVCNFNVLVSTNAVAGYVAYIQSGNNGILADGSKQIAPASASTISAGNEGWGVGTSESGLGSAGEIPTTSTCSSANSPTLTGLTGGSYTVARYTQPADTRSTNVCVGATISSTTPAGSYTDTVTITVVGNF